MNDASTESSSTEAADGPASLTRRLRRRGFRVLVISLVVGLGLMAALDALLLVKRRRYEAEIQRLRASMTDLERRNADAIVAQEENKLRVAIELIRRQSRLEPALHLSVALDSSTMYLEHEGALLRAMPVDIGPERPIGIEPDTVRLAPPRGVRTIARITTAEDAWDVPDWVYVDRALPPPPQRLVRGALGPAAIVLDGGTIIYSTPGSGPLDDPTYVLPGAVRVRPEDLRAILPNLRPGMRVYFY